MINTYSPEFISDTTLNQMGGKGRLAMMTNARNFGYTSDPATKNVTTRFVHMLAGKTDKKVNMCEITYLRKSDSYAMKFIRYKKPTAKNGFRAYVKPVAKYTDVQASQLFELFEKNTGLSLSIPKIVSKTF